MNGNGYYRKGRVYYYAVYIKSKGHWKVWWLYPGGRTLAHKRYSAGQLAGSYKLKNKPSNTTLSKAWQLKSAR